jgi:hypothetical protein
MGACPDQFRAVLCQTSFPVKLQKN